MSESDQLGLALTSGSRLGASWLDSTVGTGATDGAVLDDDELQAPTKRAAPRMRIARRDLNGQVLLGFWGHRPPYEPDLPVGATTPDGDIAAA